MDKYFENLIVKFLTKEANLDELKQLETWIKNPENEMLFFEYIKTNALVKMIANDYDKKNAKSKIARRIRQEKSIFQNKNNFRSIVKYAVAASVVGVLCTIYFLRNNILEETITTNPISILEDIETGTDRAILTLEDGSSVTLEKGTTYETENANSNGEKIVYEEKKFEKIKYNYLTIPRGGQFFVKLSDGTQVWLNSDSQLKYPTSFKSGTARKVELVYGEAFFDVSPSALHGGSTFEVTNKSQEIKVLGTEFNIKAYKDEDIIYTTLVEGKIALNTSSLKKVLRPNQQSTLNILNNTVNIVKVDVRTEISWVHGKFIFQQESLEKITTVLSRWYDVSFEFKSKSLGESKFNGELGKRQKLEDILELIKHTNYINDYEIKGKTIILK